jgi:AcrR family transcriptional regulator
LQQEAGTGRRSIVTSIRHRPPVRTAITPYAERLFNIVEYSFKSLMYRPTKAGSTAPMRKTRTPKARIAALKAEVNGRPTQERILAAAEDLFADAGYEGTSIRQIALKAGVPVALVSYHFGGKLGLYRRVFESHAPTLVAERRAGLALAALEQDPERRLAAIVQAVLVPMLGLRSAEGRRSLGRLLAREVSDPRSGERGIIGDLLDPIAVAVTDLLAATLPERSAAEIQWAYQMMVGTMTFIMADAGRIRAISGGACDPEDVDATLRHIIPLILDGFRNGRTKGAQ